MVSRSSKSITNLRAGHDNLMKFGYDTNFKDITELQAVLEKIIIWDLTH